jgi:16S rRNA (uracil1498-N3)-methyltransferase
MSRYDFRSPRLFVDHPLAAGSVIPLDPDQANYLGNVLRLRAGGQVLLFNGRDGEWSATLSGGKKLRAAEAGTCLRPQPPPGDLHLMFAPLKHARLDYMVQKAVEMGVSRLQPILTRHTQVARINRDRMRANAIEAAEQCGILAVPEVAEPVDFKAIAFQPGRVHVFCDEDAEVADPVAALAALRPQPSALMPLAAPPEVPKLAVLVGPEGGFSEDERERLRAAPGMVRIALGPRILRADTAAVAALAVVQAVLGDWRGA